jgi:hypothetical protein
MNGAWFASLNSISRTHDNSHGNGEGDVQSLAMSELVAEFARSDVFTLRTVRILANSATYLRIFDEKRETGCARWQLR